jgi:hypothetical protein
MVRPRKARPLETAAASADFEDLRSTIARALDVTPVDSSALRQAVWTYVGAERAAGAPAGHVLLALTEMIEGAPIDAGPARQALTRRVILWSVEAYFGHLGGDVVGRDGMALADTGSFPAARE